jgi:hypothetical protein
MPKKIAVRVALEIHQRKRPNAIAPACGWAAANIVRNAIQSDESSCRPTKSTVAHKKRGVVLLRSQHSVDHGQDYRHC